MILGDEENCPLRGEKQNAARQSGNAKSSPVNSSHIDIACTHSTGMQRVRYLPRLIRLRDAADYLGMDRNRFNLIVRPCLISIPIGKQGIAFDRLDLDDWADQYKYCNGRPGRKQGERLWDEEKNPVSSREREYGTSTNGSKGKEFAKALDRLNLRKQTGTSRD